MMKSANVIIVSLCKSASLLARCLHALEQVPGFQDLHVVVVLSADDVRRAKFERELSSMYCYPDNVLRIVTSPGLSFAENSNIGAKHAKEGHFLFLNDDTVVDPNFMERPLQILDQDPTVGVVGSRCLFPSGRIQHAGIVFLSRCGTQIAEHCFVGYEGNHWLVNIEREFQAVTGACLFVRGAFWREAFKEFDTSYRNGFEDLDLCFTARCSWNLKVVYAPSSKLIHHEGFSRESADRNMKGNIRNFLSRWAPEIDIDYDLIHDPDYRLYGH
jgi:GT2 family glycosyltransferase